MSNEGKITLKIHTDVYQLLQEYTQKTGVNIIFAAEQAVREYLKDKDVDVGEVDNG